MFLDIFIVRNASSLKITKTETNCCLFPILCIFVEQLLKALCEIEMAINVSAWRGTLI